MPDAAAPGADAAPDAIKPFEIIHVDSPVVACDGGDGALGHPRVWLRIVAHEIVCPYCSRQYVLNPGVAPDPGH